MFSSFNPPCVSLPSISGLIFKRKRGIFLKAGEAAWSSNRRGVSRGLKSRRDGDCQQSPDAASVRETRAPRSPFGHVREAGLGVHHCDRALGGSETQ